MEGSVNIDITCNYVVRVLRGIVGMVSWNGLRKFLNFLVFYDYIWV